MDRTPGFICQATKPVNVQDGTSPRTPSSIPGHTRGPHDVSFEIGACFALVPSRLSGLDPAEMQVLAWLRANRGDIVRAEQTFRVDRRAIAGAIAWEMLENVKPSSLISVGVGKVHLYDFSKSRPLTSLWGLAMAKISGDMGRGTLAKEAEDYGYLPSQTYEVRKTILATPNGAITYVAGIMAAIADIGYRFGFDDIRSNPIILTNVYQSKTLETWEAALRSKPPGSGFAGGNPMDVWVGSHLSFLEDGVGSPNLPESQPVVPKRAPSRPMQANPDKSIEVVSDSTLSGIAEEEYGSWELWPLIYDHNKATIGPNPNMLRPGLRLSVVPLSRYTAREIADAKRRAPTWKQFK